MTKRPLGKSGITISPLVFGGNVFGWTIDEATSFKILDAFMGAGFQCIDTADVYSKWATGNKGGESETILGRWMKQRSNRSQVILATKVGMEMGPSKKGLSKAYILQAVEDSLKRLQTDYIDLYQSHTDDADTKQEETLEAYDLLVKQGKVRAIGASNFSGARLDSAIKLSEKHGYPIYCTLQPHYNLCERTDYENDLEPVCLKHSVGVIPYFSLAAGFLTGKYRSEADLSKSTRGPGLKKYLNTRGLAILEALDQVAKQYGSKPASVALAWLLARPSITAPIVSATSLDQLQSLIAATELQLDRAAIHSLDGANA